MMDIDVALEALGVLCNANVTSVQKQGSGGGSVRADGGAGQQVVQRMGIPHFIHTILVGEETCPQANFIFNNLKTVPQGAVSLVDISPRYVHPEEKPTGNNLIIDEDEFFDRRFDYDFTKLEDTETYYRGGEVYKRPCGWQRFALKVLDKYGENKWLGNRYRSTQSVPDEWPVSYHGTSKKGAECIIEEYYKSGPRKRYGRGIYSTPSISVARGFAKQFKSQKTGKSYKVILQNRINPKYRQKHNDDEYWLIPIEASTSDTEEQEMVQRAIRPYGLLLKEV